MWDADKVEGFDDDEQENGRGRRPHPRDGGRRGDFPAWPGLGGPFGPAAFGAAFGPRRGGGRHGQPVPPWVAGLLGFDAPPQHGHGGGPKVRRGDVRAAILDVLASGPRNGYQVISEIAERSHGAWKPSPGSVYPTIQQLEDEGLVVADDARGRRTLTLSDEGQEYVARHTEELAAVWRPFAPRAEGPQGALPEIGQVMNALWQIVSTGTDAQRKEALTVLAEARRRLYGILAEGDE
ncbi:PadR family transcriptional regulator [Nocardioides sp. CPCC 205120]|uniref:PadR family transcriptional regulator n=1 Tax=Nocardioides sp. CPCC 205120 TaxID=3406462 RepID=UPI003B50A150